MKFIRSRIVAFLIDMFIIIFLSSSISNLSYMNPYKYEYEDAYSKYMEVINEATNDVMNINPEYLTDKIIPIYYKMEKYNVFLYIYYLVFTFLYFSVFSYFTHGETLGKKLVKIRVVNERDENPKFIQYLVRTLFNGTNAYLGINIILFIKVVLIFLIKDAENLYYTFSVLSLLSIVIELLLIILLIKNKHKSLNDMLAKTKVIDLKNKV